MSESCACAQPYRRIVSFAMSRFLPFSIVVIVCLIVACASREEARNQHGLESEETEHIPAGSPGPGLERVRERPDSTPTPRPTSAIDRPLDPAGLPQ